MLSSCGTSLLTNGASSELRGLLMRWANFVRGAVPEEVRAQLEPHFANQRQRFLEAAEPEAKRLSAELNGLLTYFEQSPYPREQALHYLLISATWQGEIVGDILRSWLEGRGFRVQILALPDLVTDPLERFQNGLACRHHFFTDAVAGNAGDVVGFHGLSG